MKKVLLFCVTLMLICGCSCSVNNTAKGATENFLNKYNTHDTKVLTELNTYVDNEDLTSAQKETYKAVLKRQYKDMKYEIVDEKYEDDRAIIRVKVSVYDLYEAQREAEEYLIAHRDEFNNDSLEYDASLFMDYKLELMGDYDKRVEHYIDIELEKNESGNWEVLQLPDEDLEKIHGVYNEE